MELLLASAGFSMSDPNQELKLDEHLMAYVFALKTTLCCFFHNIHTPFIRKGCHRTLEFSDSPHHVDLWRKIFTAVTRLIDRGIMAYRYFCTTVMKITHHKIRRSTFSGSEL